MTLSPDLRQRIEQILGSDDVVLFMKGTRSFPQCGFSAQVVGILKEVGTPFDNVVLVMEAANRLKVNAIIATQAKT